MPETPSFVVNDRRKFTAEGELRHEDSAAAPAAPESPEGKTPESAEGTGPQLVPAAETQPAPGSPQELADLPESSAFEAVEGAGGDRELQSYEDYADDSQPPAPTEEQTTEATRAYDATVDRLDTALRAADPGGERMAAMSFERLTQSLYTQALMLLGGGTQPGEAPRVDILGARQTIDMIAIIAEKTRGNLSSDEDKLLQSALFDLRMGFLEITQALARQARQTAGAGAPGGANPLGSGMGSVMGSGPRIVR